MENATKALLIAAAVLIAILIISLGLVIYNRASETVNNAGDLSEYEIQQHNEKFTKYEGDNVSGSDVNAMITTVFNYNLKQANTSDYVLITDSTGNGADISTSMSTSTTPTKVPTGARYSIKCNLTNGMVTSITINNVGADDPDPDPDPE